MPSNIPILYALKNPVRVTADPPGAGLDLGYLNDTLSPFIVSALAFTLTTSATVATRRMSLSVLEPLNPDNVEGVLAADTQAASLTRLYIFGVFGFQPSAINLNIFVPMAPMIVMPGETLATQIVNLQAGDNLGSIYITKLDIANA